MQNHSGAQSERDQAGDAEIVRSGGGEQIYFFPEARADQQRNLHVIYTYFPEHDHP